MVFAYYKKLTAAQRRIYRQSDQIAVIRLSHAVALRPLVVELARALKLENRRHIQYLCQRLADAITQELRVAAVQVRVLTVRPHHAWGELHGLYMAARQTGAARIQLWMRTAKQRRIVAFRTFLRTLLHELCHHLDYELLGLPDTFHTEGFYKREANLFRQLLSGD